MPLTKDDISILKQASRGQDEKTGGVYRISESRLVSAFEAAGAKINKSGAKWSITTPLGGLTRSFAGHTYSGLTDDQARQTALSIEQRGGFSGGILEIDPKHSMAALAKQTLADALTLIRK